MKTLVIKTPIAVHNPEYLFGGYVLRFNTTKYNSAFNFKTVMPTNDSTLLVTLKSYNGKLTFSNGTEVPVDFTEEIEGVTVYGYNRTATPQTTAHSMMTFKPTESVTRVDVLKEDASHLTISLAQLNTGDKEYCKFEFAQTLINNASIYELVAAYCACKINLDDLKDMTTIGLVSCSGNTLIEGSIESLVNSAEAFVIGGETNASTLLALYNNRNVHGDLKILVDAISEVVASRHNPITMNTSLANTGIKYDGGDASNITSVTFAADGTPTINRR